MDSERLRYTPVRLADVAAFHALAVDRHVRQYLLDGRTMAIEWTEDRIRASDALFARRGVGIWLAHERTSGELVGFCGFLEFPDVHPDPQLVYALFERFTGRGYATEMARASMAEARRHPEFSEILASVDEVNSASVRILEKLGFERERETEGAFGKLLVYRQSDPSAATSSAGPGPSDRRR